MWVQDAEIMERPVPLSRRAGMGGDLMSFWTAKEYSKTLLFVLAPNRLRRAERETEVDSASKNKA